ncbi:uncharacterized protein LOC121918079 [Sceloporus undulatus]|uniref:uncharacterized protein LOC121918079 n=1 Tax=Sceloporus undulatus TaxID=8520 RepID=UPI001C4B5824|nr:uncharacterized protein LOC121918079 [Sceloporus undulatus]
MGLEHTRILVYTGGLNGSPAYTKGPLYSYPQLDTLPSSTSLRGAVIFLKKKVSKSYNIPPTRNSCLPCGPGAFLALPLSVPPSFQLGNENYKSVDAQNAWLPSSETPSATNYFLQYISSSIENSTHNTAASSNKFVFGQNMSERVLSPPKSNDASTDSNKENAAGDSGSESSSQEATPEKGEMGNLFSMGSWSLKILLGETPMKKENSLLFTPPRAFFCSEV